MSVNPYSSLFIKAFRGLREMRIEQCGDINILVGGNNSGKTTVLELLVLLSNPLDVTAWEQAVNLRKAWPFADAYFRSSATERLDSLAWLFPKDGEHTLPIEIISQRGEHVTSFRAEVSPVTGVPPTTPVRNGQEYIEATFSRGSALGEHLQDAEVRGLKIQIYEDQSPFQMHLWSGARARAPQLRSTASIAFATPISHRSDGYLAASMAKVFRSLAKPKALGLIQAIDPDVQDLEMILPDDGDPSAPLVRTSPATLHVRHARAGLVPVHAMGDGTRRAIHLASLVASLPRGGVLLLDELEVGMHTSVLSGVFRWLLAACRDNGIQLFATTHSLEAIDTLLDAAPGEDIVLYRLEDGKVKRIGGEMLRTVRNSLGAEVR